MRRMITFDEGRVRFTNRVVGIALDGDRVLLHRTDDMQFWALPGGRAELLEPSPETLKREMREEIGVEVEVERLLWLAENFFVYLGQSYHELGLYFLMSLPANSPLREQTTFLGREGSMLVHFEWHPIATLEDLPLYPKFLRTGLKSLPTATTHLIYVESAAESAQP
jgi:ADP-ribose pyrophosphatase YjhB (NUDIX family)